MDSPKELLEQRLVPWKVMDDIVKKAKEESRPFTAEERQEFDSAADDCDRLKQLADDTHRAAQVKTGIEERQDIPPAGPPNSDLIPSGGGDVFTPEEQGRAFRSWLLAPTGEVSQEDLSMAERCGYHPHQRQVTLPFNRGVRGAPKTVYEAAMRREEVRAQSVGTTTAGGNFVADEAMAAVDLALLAFGGMRQVSTIMTTASGADLPIPTSDDTSNTGAILSENLEDSEQDITMGQVVLQSYKYTSKIVRVSVEFLQDSNVQVAGFVGSRLGERLGRITNTHFTTGTGSSQPNGIVTAATASGVTTASNTALTFSEILQLKHSVDIAYRGTAGFMCHDTVLRYMKELTSDPNQNRPLWNPALAPGGSDLFDGHPVHVNNDVATGASAKAILFGELSKYTIREVAGITLVRLDERFAEYHQVAWLAFLRTDADLIDAGTNPVKYLTLAS